MNISRRRIWVSIVLATWLWPASAAWGFSEEGSAAAPAAGGPVQFRHQAFEVTPSTGSAISAATALAALPGMLDFQSQHAGRWDATWDRRGNRPNLIQGSGIPVVPGRGNTLQPADVGLAPAQDLTLPVIEQLLRRFIGTHAGLFRVAQKDLRLHPDSGQAGPQGRLWLVEFEVLHDGVPVRGARVFFRINSGNITQLGTDLVGDVQVNTRPTVDASRALTLALTQAGVAAAAAEVIEPGALRIYPELPAGEAPGERYTGADGTGYTYRLVWEVDFRRAGDHRTYRAVVDAQSGAVLELYDTNRYVTATVTGGIFPSTNTDPETSVPLANLTVHNRGTKVTDEDGQYEYAGGFAWAQLIGPLVRTQDSCGFSFLLTLSPGNLDFGTSTGTNCVTPGKGGPGNTHASRSTFHHLNVIKEVGMGLLPSNNWLPNQLIAKTNLNQQCNAFWDGSRVNFFRSGGGCSNSGEIAAIVLHEFGHGLDQNTGGAALEDGSGEAVGDITAFLETRDGCMGPNFRPGVPCQNCRNSCTGVRDLVPFSSGGEAAIARPSTVESDTGINCDRFACGATQPCKGPMGYECHCESLIASTAAWDLTQLLVAHSGVDTGYTTMRQLWYDSLVPSKSAYRVVSGGQCAPDATVDGCGASNWYTVLLAVDDDDGNLANGTPNGCRIWQAFNDHGIACGTQPACTQ